MGLHGSHAYVRAHADELDEIRVVLNLDVVGLAAPVVLAVQNSAALATYLQGDATADLGVLCEDSLVTAHSDHFPFVLSGVPSVAAHTSRPRGGDHWAHTPGDTLDKLDVRELREATGTVARLLLRAAAAPGRLPRARQTPAAVEKALVEAGLQESLRIQGWWPF
jgi:Zn-dependent M28 family amino/carboxypeptidase